MERLTERKINKHDASWVVKNKGYKAAAERLAEYEGTGLTPEGILKLKAENERLQADCATMREAMEEFCVRVEKGEIRSRRTYSKFMELLRSTIHYKAVR